MSIALNRCMVQRMGRKLKFSTWRLLARFGWVTGLFVAAAAWSGTLGMTLRACTCFAVGLGGFQLLAPGCPSGITRWAAAEVSAATGTKPHRGMSLKAKGRQGRMRGRKSRMREPSFLDEDARFNVLAPGVALIQHNLSLDVLNLCLKKGAEALFADNREANWRTAHSRGLGREETILKDMSPFSQLLGLAQDFCQNENLQLQTVAVQKADPHSPAQKFHFDDETQDYVTVLLPLHETPVEMGGTYIKPLRTIVRPSYPEEALIFSGKVLHRGAANKSNRPRWFAYAAFSEKWDFLNNVLGAQGGV